MMSVSLGGDWDGWGYRLLAHGWMRKVDGNSVSWAVRMFGTFLVQPEMMVPITAQVISVLVSSVSSCLLLALVVAPLCGKHTL